MWLEILIIEWIKFIALSLAFGLTVWNVRLVLRGENKKWIIPLAAIIIIVVFLWPGGR